MFVSKTKKKTFYCIDKLTSRSYDIHFVSEFDNVYSFFLNSFLFVGVIRYLFIVSVCTILNKLVVESVNGKKEREKEREIEE